MTSSVRISNTNKLGGERNDLSDIGAITCHPKIIIGNSSKNNTVIDKNKLTLSHGGLIVIGTSRLSTTINSSSITTKLDQFPEYAKATIGKAVFGGFPNQSDTNAAKFCHVDYQNSLKYTLEATSDGQTWINSSYDTLGDGRIVFAYNNNQQAVLENGRFGIGSFNGGRPDFPLHVDGPVTPKGSTQNWRFAYGWSGLYTNNVGFQNVQAYIDGDFWGKGNVASGNYNSSSDERIKENIVDVNASENLDIFRSIKVRNYAYKDKVLRGFETTAGFIAQEIKEILPSYVNTVTLALPNIYKLGIVSGEGNNIITIEGFDTATLLSGDNVTGNIEIRKYPSYTNDIKAKLKTVIDQNTIEVEDDLSEYMGDMDDEGNATEGAKVYVYGQEVDDFLLIDKMKLFTITSGALQEVDRQLQAEKAKHADLVARIAVLENA